VLNLCTDEGTAGAPDKASGCFANIRSGNTTYNLKSDGKGVPLGTAMSRSCPTPGRLLILPKGAGRQQMTPHVQLNACTFTECQ